MRRTRSGRLRDGIRVSELIGKLRNRKAIPLGGADVIDLDQPGTPFFCIASFPSRRFWLIDCCDLSLTTAQPCFKASWKVRGARPVAGDERTAVACEAITFLLARGTSLIGATLPRAPIGVADAPAVRRHTYSQGVSGLVDFKRYGLRWLGRCQHAVAIGFAVHLETDGQANCNRFPGDIPARVFF